MSNIELYRPLLELSAANGGGGGVIPMILRIIEHYGLVHPKKHAPMVPFAVSSMIRKNLWRDFS